MNPPASKTFYYGRRIEARQSKLRAMSDEQNKCLLRWLNEDKVTYKEARKRLVDKFGLSLCINTISRFYHRHNDPLPTSDVVQSPILLDVVFRSARPVNLIVRQKAGGIRLIQEKQ